MASHEPMDADGIAGACIAACCTWTDTHQQEVNELGFEVLEVEAYCLTFRADGKLFQLILPGGLFSGGCSAGENFVAMSVDGSAKDSLMTVLNEKLERVRVHPSALSEVFDVFVRVLTGQSSRPASGAGNWQAREVGTTTAGPQEMVGVELDYGSEIGSEGELGSDDEDGDLHEVDDHEHDDYLDEFTSNLMVELDGRTSRKRPVERSQGHIYLLAEAARLQCEAANSGSSFQLGPPQGSARISSAEVKDTIKYCSVSVLPQICGVQLHMELQALINDKKIAGALGLSFDDTLEVVLEFDKYFWEPLCSKPLESTVVVARQGIRPKFSHEEAHKKTNPSAEEFEALYKTFFGHQAKTSGYGLSSLIPELVRVFFSYRAKKVSRGLRAMEWKNQQLDALLDQAATIENPLTGLLYFLGAQLRQLPAWCVVCWGALPESLCRIRTCQNELCLYEFEELRLGFAILQEVQESPEVVNLEMDLACAAASTARDVFEPFPGQLLANPEVRGRSGWFSHAVPPPSPNTLTHVVTAVKLSEAAAQGLGNKNMKLLLSTLQSIPPVVELSQSADEKALRKILAMAGYTGLGWKTGKEMCLSYDLLRFILSTNRLSLRFLDQSSKIPCLQAFNQFAVMHDSPEREEAFEMHRRRHKTFFAFHGSSLVNWYSILRNGLRSMSSTMYMSSGAAHGPGIYLGNNFALSYSYSRVGNEISWKNSTGECGQIVAICEVVEGCCSVCNASGIFVVPPGTQDQVIVRYIIVCPPNSYDISQNYTITGTVLRGGDHPSHHLHPLLPMARSSSQGNGTSDSSRHTTDLRQHFRDLKASYKELHSVQLKNQKAEALAKIRQLHVATAKSHSSVPVAGGGGGEVPAAGQTAASNNLTAEGLVYGRKRWKNEVAAAAAPAPDATPAATQAIVKEYRKIQKEISTATGGAGGRHPTTGSFLTNIAIDIPDEGNFYTWHVRLFQNVFSSSPLFKDLGDWARLKKQETPHILLEVTFSGRFPFQPPFIRVVYPMFAFHTGHVTIGGSICMELLTESGWSPANSIEMVLVQIVHAIMEGGGRIDKTKGLQEYSAREAQEAFNRVAATHGWKVSARS